MSLNKCIASLLTRLLLGFIFLMQGFGKIFTIGVDNLYKSDFFYGTFNSLLPDWLIYSTAYYTSYIELIGGLFLVLGFKTNYALYALGSVLVIVTFGHGLAQPIWDLSDVIFRAVLLIALLIYPKEWHLFSLDKIIEKRE